jgi:hypothetical protein
MVGGEIGLDVVAEKGSCYSIPLGDDCARASEPLQIFVSTPSVAAGGMSRSSSSSSCRRWALSKGILTAERCVALTGDIWPG